jgi:hypothetical protein
MSEEEDDQKTQDDEEASESPKSDAEREEENADSPPPATRTVARGVASVLGPKGAGRSTLREESAPSSPAFVQERVRTPPARSRRGTRRAPPIEVVDLSSPPASSPARVPVLPAGSPPREQMLAQGSGPFSVCDTVTDLYRIPVMLYLSQISRSFLEKGVLLLIVGDAAVNFHAAASQRETHCGPVEIVAVFVKYVVDKRTNQGQYVVAPPVEGEEDVRRSAYISLFDAVRGVLVKGLNDYSGALDPTTREAIEAQCSCRLGRGDSLFTGTINSSRLELLVTYSTFAEDQETSRHELVNVHAYNPPTDAAQAGRYEPKPVWLPYQSRFYAALGYLLERATHFSTSSPASVKARYMKQRAHIVGILDKGLLSCESVSGAVKACLFDPRSEGSKRINRYVSEQQQQEVAKAEKRAATGELAPEITTPEGIISLLVRRGIYPRVYADALLQSVKDNQTDVESLVAARLAYERDIQRVPEA